MYMHQLSAKLWAVLKAVCGCSPAIKLDPTCAMLQIKRPMVVAGVSLGGAVALDFAVSHPEAVSKLVLVDAQVNCGCLGSHAQLIRRD